MPLRAIRAHQFDVQKLPRSTVAKAKRAATTVLGFTPAVADPNNFVAPWPRSHGFTTRPTVPQPGAHGSTDKSSRRAFRKGVCRIGLKMWASSDMKHMQSSRGRYPHYPTVLPFFCQEEHLFGEFFEKICSPTSWLLEIQHKTEMSSRSISWRRLGSCPLNS